MTAITLSALGLERLNKVLDRLSRKAEKLGIEKPTVVVHGSEMIRDDADGSYIEMFSVTVEQSNDIIINGWQFAATLDNSFNGGTVVRTNPSFAHELPKQYYDTDTHCDHCNTMRRRNDVYVLYNETTNEYKQIGSSCLIDFLGHTSAEAIAEYYDGFEGTIEEVRDNDQGYFGASERHYAIDTYLAHVVAIISKYGYVSAKMAEETGKQQTKKMALDNYIESQKRDSRALPVSDTHYNQAMTALTWAKDHYISKPISEQSDYDHNMAVLLQESYVTERQLGYIASIIPSHDRHIEKEIAKKNTASSAFVGSIGEKITITATLARILEFEGFYGMTYIHIFNAAGNILVWKTNKKVAQTEQEVTIKGTIKDHKLYNETKQTELTRCKVRGTV